MATTVTTTAMILDRRNWMFMTFYSSERGEWAAFEIGVKLDMFAVVCHSGADCDGFPPDDDAYV